MATALSPSAHYACELLSSVGPCVAKRMFGGWGISTDGLTVAILADLGQGETLWLKAHEQTRAQFVAEGCQRFCYDSKTGPRSVDYYSAPEAAMDSLALMAPWARLALQAALLARNAKAAPRKPKATASAAKAATPATPRRSRSK